MFSFVLSSVISKVFVADFEHAFVCWKRYRIKIIVLLTLKFSQQTDNCSKLAAETVYYYYVKHAFQSGSALYSCLNVKELLAQNRSGIC